MTSPRVAALLARNVSNRGRLVIAIDATASRQPTWDMAAKLTGDMFEEASKVGNLSVQLCWYRGRDECSHSSWATDPHELIEQMGRIRCEAGATQIKRVLDHIRTEHQREKIGAAVLIGDACEERRRTLYDIAAGLDVPLFMFEEGDGLAMRFDQHGWPVDDSPQTVEQIFRELARLTGGAFAKFDAGAAARLGELLRAVAAFAIGGRGALSNLHSETAQKLLTQMK